MRSREVLMCKERYAAERRFGLRKAQLPPTRLDISKQSNGSSRSASALTTAIPLEPAPLTQTVGSAGLAGSASLARPRGRPSFRRVRRRPSFPSAMIAAPLGALSLAPQRSWPQAIMSRGSPHGLQLGAAYAAECVSREPMLGSRLNYGEVDPDFGT